MRNHFELHKNQNNNQNAPSENMIQFAWDLSQDLTFKAQGQLDNLKIKSANFFYNDIEMSEQLWKLMQKHSACFSHIPNLPHYDSQLCAHLINRMAQPFLNLSPIGGYLVGKETNSSDFDLTGYFLLQPLETSEKQRVVSLEACLADLTAEEQAKVTHYFIHQIRRMFAVQKLSFALQSP